MSTLQTTILKHPDSASNQVTFTAGGDINFDSGAVFIDSSNNRVGIGTTSPSSKLHVADGGGIFIQDTGGTERTTQILQSGNSLFVDIRDNTSNGQLVIRGKGGGSASEYARFDTSGRLLVGTSSAISGSGAQDNLQLVNSAGSILSVASSDTTIADGTRIGEVQFWGQPGSTWGNFASIGCFGDGTATSNDNPGRLAFFTTSDGAPSPTERLRVTKDGVIKHTGLRGGGGDNKLAQYVVPSHNTNEEDVLIFQAENEGASNQLTFGGGTSSFNAATKIRFLTAQAVDTTAGTERMRIDSDGVMRMSEPAQSGDGGVALFTSDVGTANQRGRMIFYSKTGTSAGQEIIQIFSGSTEKLRMRADGNIMNVNNSYDVLSDRKLKENIVDAASQWDDIKGLRIRKYNLIDDPSLTQIGVVAQELETVSPGLVDDLPDKDEDGNDLGTVTKAVKASVLYMKAVKALQEAMARIEELEAKVAALEAG